jgi:CRP-like cAMP-binding protein
LAIAYRALMEWRLFDGLPAEDVRRVIAASRRRVFARGEVVFHRGDPGDTLHLITKGRFAVRVVTSYGDASTLSILGPGETFGEMALLSEDSIRSATVSALEPGETQSLRRDDFARLRRDRPDVTEVVLAVLAEQLRRTTDRLIEALYVDADTRVRRRLIELAEQYAGHGGPPIVIPLTQDDIAGLAGTSRATVNRTLRAEQRNGTITLARGRVLVEDLDELNRRR